MDGAVASMALNAAVQGGSAFSNFLPKITDVSAKNPNDESYANDIRMGEIAAITVTIGIGVIASSLCGSSVPAVTSLVMCAILVALYEIALAAHTEGK